MPTAAHYEQQIQAKLKDRDAIDAEIARLQNIHNNYHEREQVIKELRRQVLQYDVALSDLYPDAQVLTPEPKPRGRKPKQRIDDEIEVATEGINADHL